MTNVREVRYNYLPCQVNNLYNKEPIRSSCNGVKTCTVSTHWSDTELCEVLNVKTTLYTVLFFTKLKQSSTDCSTLLGQLNSNSQAFYNQKRNRLHDEDCSWIPTLAFSTTQSTFPLNNLPRVALGRNFVAIIFTYPSIIATVMTDPVCSPGHRGFSVGGLLGGVWVASGGSDWLRGLPLRWRYLDFSEFWLPHPPHILSQTVTGSNEIMAGCWVLSGLPVLLKATDRSFLINSSMIY